VKRLAAFVLALGGLAAPAAVVIATHALADTLGRNFGALAASTLLGLKPALQAREREPEPVAPAPLPEPKDELAAEVLPAPQATGRRPGARSKVAAPPRALGVRVSAQKVLELARRRAIPQAAFVPASGARPAGLQLSSVVGLGVGMRDGDILTRVAGTEVRSVGTVADLVIRARARQAPEISAEFWREGVRGTLVVEQPYTHGDAGAAASDAQAPSTP
jgi:hypothetical protein